MPPASSLGIIRWFVAGGALLASALYSSGFANRERESETDRHGYSLTFHYSSLSDDPEPFVASIQEARRRLLAHPGIAGHKSGLARWGIVTHHLLARNLIAEYFQKLSAEIHPGTIVLIGPNHFARGHHPLAISRLPWKTPFGIVPEDRNLVSRILTDRIASLDEDAFVQEHSIGALVPFIKYYFPDASIVTLVVRSDADTSQGLRLADFAARIAGSNVFFLASLDFSHYKPSPVAVREDDSTLAILSGFASGLYQQAYVDSHITFFTLLAACQSFRSPSIEIVHHTNSGIIMNDQLSPCTSYINAIIRSSEGDK